MLISRTVFRQKILHALNKAKKAADPKTAFMNDLDILYNEINPTDADNMTPEERRCYGSPLNKFCDSIQNQKRKLSVINIDLLIYDDNKKQFRFVEYKHGNEGMSKGQKATLEELAKCLKESTSYKADVCVIQADYPFEYAMITNISKETNRGTDREGLINYINLIESERDKRL